MLATVVNHHLVCDPTIQQPGFDLPRQTWTPLNCFRTGQGPCCACLHKWCLVTSDSVRSSSDNESHCRHVSVGRVSWWRLTRLYEDAANWLNNIAKQHSQCESMDCIVIIITTKKRYDMVFILQCNVSLMICDYCSLLTTLKATLVIECLRHSSVGYLLTFSSLVDLLICCSNRMSWCTKISSVVYWQLYS